MSTYKDSTEFKYAVRDGKVTFNDTVILNVKDLSGNTVFTQSVFLGGSSSSYVSKSFLQALHLSDSKFSFILNLFFKAEPHSLKDVCNFITVLFLYCENELDGKDEFFIDDITCRSRYKAGVREHLKVIFNINNDVFIYSVESSHLRLIHAPNGGNNDAIFIALDVQDKAYLCKKTYLYNPDNGVFPSWNQFDYVAAYSIIVNLFQIIQAKVSDLAYIYDLIGFSECVKIEDIIKFPFDDTLKSKVFSGPSTKIDILNTTDTKDRGPLGVSLDPGTLSRLHHCTSSRVVTVGPSKTAVANNSDILSDLIHNHCTIDYASAEYEAFLAHLYNGYYASLENYNNKGVETQDYTLTLLNVKPVLKAQEEVRLTVNSSFQLM